MDDDSGTEWVIIHNSDWSGMATVVQDKSNSPPIELPGAVLRNACRQAVISEVQIAIEDALDKL